MGTAAIVALVLQAMQAVLAEIAAIRGQAGVTDDQLAAQTEPLFTANDQLYAALKALIAVPVKPAA